MIVLSIFDWRGSGQITGQLSLFGVASARSRLESTMQTLRLTVLSILIPCSLFVLAGLTQNVAIAQEQFPLNNDGVLAMVHEKFDDATIVRMIQRHKTNFDLSVDAVIRLKQAGASEAVLQAMIAATPDGRTASPVTDPVVAKTPHSIIPSDVPDEIGVYVRQKDELVAIEPEIVNWQTGGVLKHYATLHLDRGHLNGTVAGPHSGFTISSAPYGRSGAVEFVIRCADGNSASEYQLLKFWQKSDRREFRSITGGVLHESSGAKNNVIAFQFKKISPRTYVVALPSIGGGEFGFLAPGMAASADMASRGKVYTFRIIE
jgi:hypothetical protein